MFNIYLGIFIVVALFVVLGGSYKLFSSFGAFAGILFLIGSIAIFATYGTKWFSTKQGIFSETPVKWPPVINTCPDYLTYYGRKKADGSSEDSCIDLIGVSNNGSLKVFPKGGSPPVSDDYYFSLVTKASDVSAKHAELCQRAIAAGLTWEGITNGESCTTPGGPAAPGSSGAASGGCPAS